MENDRRGPTPERVELPRIELRRDLQSRVSVQRSTKPGITSTNELLASLPTGAQLAVVEFHALDHEGWFKESLFTEALLKRYPHRFMFEGREWYLIGGTINGAGRGELLACTDKHALSRIVATWDGLDGLNRVKALSRLMQPSIAADKLTLKLVVIDDPVHDGDALLGQSGVAKQREAFVQPEATVFKCISHWLKVVFRRVHRRWDVLPQGIACQDGELYLNDKLIDGILYRDNIKLGKDQFSAGQIIELTEQDFRLHSTERHTNFHRAGISRQLLQYLPAKVAEPLVAASDIPLMGSNWAKALTGDVDALRYVLHHDPDDNAEEHEIRSQLIRHLDAGCQDVTIPYLRQRVLPLPAGIFKNRIRKGRCPGAYLYAAPSMRLGKFELSVPTRMLSHEERDRIKAGESIEVLATRYPITGHQSINRMSIVGMHRGAVVYVNPKTWLDSFQGDFDGDCVTILRVSPAGWENSEPFIPPATPKPMSVTAPRALELAATSKRDVALGETVVADYIHLQWEQHGKLDPEELNELGARVICAAVDRAKHGTVSWGMSADEFTQEFLPERFRHRHSILAAKNMPECETSEANLRSRLWMLKEGGFETARSGWELVLALMHGWTKEVALMPTGSHAELHNRILQLHATLPAPCKRTFELVRLARRRWATAVDYWKRTDDDSAMRSFCERLQSWMDRADETLVQKVMLELGKQLLRPKKKGNASLFLSQIPGSQLCNIYTFQSNVHAQGE
ncbi:MAG: hypothetical protein KDB68_09795 [Planctomycetes bacterium]|nr:hypothetical protein [Planctomycetota bacterium]